MLAAPQQLCAVAKPPMQLWMQQSAASDDAWARGAGMSAFGSDSIQQQQQKQQEQQQQEQRRRSRADNSFSSRSFNPIFRNSKQAVRTPQHRRTDGGSLRDLEAIRDTLRSDSEAILAGVDGKAALQLHRGSSMAPSSGTQVC